MAASNLSRAFEPFARCVTGAAAVLQEAAARRAAVARRAVVRRAVALREAAHKRRGVAHKRRVAVVGSPEAGRSSRDQASSAVHTGRDDTLVDRHKAERTTTAQPRSKRDRLRLQCG